MANFYIKFGRRTIASLFTRGKWTVHQDRTVKYLNNLIEQDYRPIKRRNKFNRSLRTASTTIKGMGTI